MPDPVRQFNLDDDSAYLPFAETSAAPIDPRDEGRNLELVSGRLTGAALNVGVLRLDPGEHHIPHRHPRGSEFYVFLRGRAIVSIGGEDHPAHRGTVAFAPAGTTHAIRNVGDERVEVLYGLDAAEYEDVGLIYEAG